MKTYLRIAILLCGLLPIRSHAQSDGLPRGAYDMPYTRYESEDGTKGGGATLKTSPQFIVNEIASEATNQKYVALPSNGSFVSWPVTKAGAGVDLRFTMPDAPGGGNGLTGSLNLYVNNIMVKTINLSSYWAYQYFVLYDSDPKNTPSPRTLMRFDEVHFKVSTKLNVGDVVKVQKDNGDAYEYGVDFIEIEDVPAALPKPAGYFSVVDYGAIPNDGVDDMTAFNNCLAAADAANTGMYIPEGQFTLASTWRPNVSNMGIKGAGMWYSNIHFSTNAFFSGGILARSTGLEISDLYISTANNIRWENGVYRIYKCFMGTYGANSSIHNVWEEHFECGLWVGGYDDAPVDVTTNLLVSHNRIRNNYADGCNFAQGTNNSTVEFSNFRNNGDDGIASWPSKDAGNNVICENLVFKNNTIENNWRAGGIGIFGGKNHQIHHNIIKDGVAGSGIRFTTEYQGYFFESNTDMKVSEMTIINCGTSTDLFDQEKGAIELYGALSQVKNITFSNVDIINAQRHGVQIGGTNVDNITFNNVNINGTGLDDQTKSAFIAPSGGYAVMAFAQTGTSTFNNLTLANIEMNPPTYKSNANYNLIINTGPAVPPTGVSISPATVSVQQGQTAQLMATVTPTNATNKNVTWASSNPAIATVNAAGLVTGVGTGTATITVKTEVGNITATRSVTVTTGPPVITSSATASGVANAAFTYTITASNNPTSYGATALPSGLSVNAATGIITGTPTTAGTFTSTVTATSAIGTGSKAVTITINPAPSAPVVSSSAAASGTIGSTFSYTITASGSPTSYGATNLPAGLSVNTSSGLISGTPSATGTFTTTLSATNANGTGSKTVTITINSLPPCTAPVIGLTTTAPVIDQNIDAAWNNVPAGSLTHVTLGSMPADFAGSKWRAMYDATNLYVLVEVKDNNKFNDSGSSWWEDDVVEIFIDGDNSKGTSYDGANDFQLGFRYNDTNIHFGGSSVTRSTGIVFAQHNVSGGYNIEVKIPWSTIGTTAAAGKQLGFEVEVDDDDNGGTRDSQVSAFATTSTAWSSPNVFGSVYLTSCGSQPVIAVTGVTVSPTTASINVGATQQLTATIAPANATNQNVTWSTSNAAVATVNASGLVTAVGNGTATITVTTQDGSKTATSAITVTTSTVAVTGVTVSPTTVTINVGSTQQLTATVAPANASNKNVTWTSSNAAVASVNASGLITALANGTSTITVKTVDGNKTATSAITVTTPTGTIMCLKTSNTITVNGSLTETGWNLSNTVSKATVGSPNNTVTFGVMWDNNNLYVGAKVLDANLNSDSSDPWEDDAVEIYIDANNNKLGSYDGLDNQIIKNYNKSTVFTKLAINGLQHAWAAISGGYSVEFAIPWSQLGITSPTQGTTIGFDLGYDDDDNGGSRDAQAVWKGTIDNYQSTAGFGSLVLNNGAATRTITSEQAGDVVTENGVVSYWPTVVETELNISTDGSYHTVDVVDMLGRVHYHEESLAGKATVVLDMGDLTEGMHLIKLKGNQKSNVFRVIKK